MSESIGRIVGLSHFPFKRFHVTRLLCLVFLALALWKHTFETSLRTLRMILFQVPCGNRDQRGTCTSRKGKAKAL